MENLQVKKLDLEENGQGYWIKNTLIRALDYKDALRCVDLLEDGLDIDDAELDSYTEIAHIL